MKNKSRRQQSSSHATVLSTTIHFLPAVSKLSISQFSLFLQQRKRDRHLLYNCHRQVFDKFFFLFLNLESGSKNPTAGEFFFSGLEDIIVWLFCVTTREH